MRKLLPLLLLAALALPAQITVTPTGPASVTPGNSFTLTLSCVGCTGAGMLDLGWSIPLPVGFTLGAPALTSSDPAGYQSACGTANCLIWGVPSVPLADGTLVTIPVSVSSSAALGPAALNVTNLLSGAAIGAVNGIVAGAPFTIKVLSKCDLNSDGAVTVADVQLVVNAYINGASCPIAAASGGCTPLSVVTEELVAAGLTACKL